MTAHRTVDFFFCWLNRLSIIALFGMGGFLAFFEQPAYRYATLPIQVITKVVHPGDTLLVRVHRISTAGDEVAYPVARWLVNVDSGERCPVKAGTTSVPAGDTTITSGNLIIPEDLLSVCSPGTFYAEGVVNVDGAIKNFKVKFRTEEFEVRK